MNKMIGVNSNGQILFTSIAALWAAFWLTPSVNAQTLPILTNTKSSADQGLSLTKAEESIKAEGRGQSAESKQQGGKVEGHDNCLGGYEITHSTLSQGGFCPNVTIHSQTTVPKPASTNQVSDAPRVNVTDLRLVGNAHPTIDKGFWRSPNAYFSAIPPRVGSTLNTQHSIFNAQVPDRTPPRDSPSIPELPPPQDIEPPPPARQPEATPSPTLPPPEQLLEPPEFSPTTPETPEGVTSEQITVKQFEFTGNTAFSDQELAEATAKFTNRPITFAELLNARTAVTQLYVDNGYATSGAFIPPQPLTQDTVTIEIVEGGLEEIQVNGLRRLRPNYVRSRIAVANPKPLNVPHLLESLRLLQLDPLIENVSAELSTGSGPGTSLLIVDIIEANTWSYQLVANNGRSPSVGSFRRGASITQANLLGFGDGVTLSYTNTDGSDEIEFEYTLPVNPRNGTVSFSFSNTSSDIIEEPFNLLDIQSDSTSFDLTFRQPLLETPTQKFELGLTASRRNTETVFLEDRFGFPSLGADEDGRIRVSALRFFQEWTQRGASEVFALRSQFNLGLGVFDATVNDDEPDSRFFSWRGQAQWVRLLAPDTLLVLQGDIQLAAQDLLPVEQIGLGGQGSVRGYRQDIRLTDNGAFASAEVRLPILRIPEWDGILQVTPFVDVGTTWNNGEIDNPDPSSLAALGLGLQWQQGDRITARLDWGIPLISVDSEGDTLQENGVYFSITINPF